MSSVEEIIDDILDVNGGLSHHGVKGMHWGIRNSVHPDIAHIPTRTRKEAKKDAEEFTRAKLFFGQGAGTRRKLIKAKVEAKKAKDPLYSKAFEHFVKQTDLGKRADQARSERKRKDTKNYVKKTAKGVGHVVRGNNQYANISAIVGVGVGSAILKKHMEDNARHADQVIVDILDENGGLSHQDVLHISEQPWSSYTEADYTIEQWHTACLIHLHDGPPTSKTQCKLPVKTPNGVLNRNGVHAAAAALAGARSPLKASPEQKAKAANALRRYYSQLGETSPDSLAQSAIDDILEHHGVKGMKWGVRRKATVGAQEVIVSDKRKSLKTSGGGGHSAHPDAVASRTSGQIARKSGTKALSNAQLKAYNERLNLEQNFKRLQYQDASPGRKFVLGVMKKKGGPGIEAGGKAALKSTYVRKKIATGAAALAIAIP